MNYSQFFIGDEISFNAFDCQVLYRFKSGNIFVILERFKWKIVRTCQSSNLRQQNITQSLPYELQLMFATRHLQLDNGLIHLRPERMALEA